MSSQRRSSRGHEDPHQSADSRPRWHERLGGRVSDRLSAQWNDKLGGRFGAHVPSDRPGSLRREAVMWGRVLGKAAWIWAQDQPIVQEQKRKIEARVAVLKDRARARISQFESEFWEWVKQLEAEGYVEVPYQAGPSLAESYARLEVNAHASDQQVRKAWRSRMLQCHPDRFAQDPQALAAAEVEARQVNEAYQVICRARGLK